MTSIDCLELNAEGFAAAFVEACTDVGFVALTGHGIAAERLQEMRSMTERLFALDDGVKQEWAIRPDNYRGFIPLGFFTPNRAEVNGAVGDFYEGYKLHLGMPRRRSPGARCTARTAGCPIHSPASAYTSCWRTGRRVTDLALRPCSESVRRCPRGRIARQFFDRGTTSPSPT